MLELQSTDDRLFNCPRVRAIVLMTSMTDQCNIQMQACSKKLHQRTCHAGRSGHSVVMAAAHYTTPSLSSAENMHTSLSGAEQLKEERLRFVAATIHHASEDSCDLSSEGDTELAECDSPSELTPEVARPTSVTMSAAGSSQQAMACYDQLPEPAAIVAAVRDMLQQHGTVSSAT